MRDREFFNLDVTSLLVAALVVVAITGLAGLVLHAVPPPPLSITSLLP